MSDIVLTSAGQVFSAFNILGLGFILVWIIGSFALARAISKKKDEFVLFSISFLSSGLILIFADDPGKWAILIVILLVIILGVFKLLWSRKNE